MITELKNKPGWRPQVCEVEGFRLAIEKQLNWISSASVFITPPCTVAYSNLCWHERNYYPASIYLFFPHRLILFIDVIIFIIFIIYQMTHNTGIIYFNKCRSIYVNMGQYKDRFLTHSPNKNCEFCLSNLFKVWNCKSSLNLSRWLFERY